MVEYLHDNNCDYRIWSYKFRLIVNSLFPVI